MTERDANLADVLNEFLPRRDEEQGDWDGIVADAHSGRRLRRSQAPTWRRRVVLALAVAGALAVLAVVPALAVSEGWWFFGESTFTPMPPTDIATPRTDIATLATAVRGSDGSSWSLDAFMSDNGVCYGIAPSGSRGRSGAGACDSDISEKKNTTSREPARALGFLAYHGVEGDSEIVAGETVGSVETVEIELANGGLVRASTVPAPESFQTELRFYLAALPEESDASKIVGKDSEGRVVGTLAIPHSGSH